jgi:hypothetical protein
MDIRLPDPELTFIFGIGSAGLTPFECLLNQRTENDAIAFRVAGSDACLFFGHVAAPIGRLTSALPEVYFRVSIVGIETPPPREIIKAMADQASHDHGAGCGCGGGCR